MSVTGPKGFRAAGRAAGIKASGAKDVSLIVSDNGPVSAAALFTTNKAQAAPVRVSRDNLASSRGKIAAIIANSGCANAATGASGIAHANATTDAVGSALSVSSQSVLVCSTGLIGVPLAIEALLSAVGPLVSDLGSSPEHGLSAAEAIMTTDTHPKQVLIEHGGIRVGGMAKGAGMIAPNMATMLAMFTTDAEVEADELDKAFRIAVGSSFNELIVDGCMSTNDTSIVLASGASGPVSHSVLVEALVWACADLAEQLALDAEGTTRTCAIHVRGARSDDDARRAARGVALSLLVKTSLYGSDPYWGRIVSELGASGADFDLDLVEVFYGESLVFSHGNEVAHDRAGLVRYLGADRVEVSCDLGLGVGQANILTTDLGHAYIDENMTTS